MIGVESTVLRQLLFIVLTHVCINLGLVNSRTTHYIMNGRRVMSTEVL